MKTQRRGRWRLRGDGEKIIGDDGEGEERCEIDLRPPDMVRGCQGEYFDVLFMYGC